jgi:hypothetical protein
MTMSNHTDSTSLPMPRCERCGSPSDSCARVESDTQIDPDGYFPISILLCDGCLGWLADQLNTPGHPSFEDLLAQMVEQCKVVPQLYLVFGGDFGGQVYLTVPMSMVKASPEEGFELLKQIDRACWGCNDGEGQVVYTQRGQPGEHVGGGMGGGLLLEGLWRHPELQGDEGFGYHRVVDGEKPIDTGAYWLQRINEGLKLDPPAC